VSTNLIEEGPDNRTLQRFSGLIYNPSELACRLVLDKVWKG
jgi:hypothetical protein